MKKRYFIFIILLISVTYLQADEYPQHFRYLAKATAYFDDEYNIQHYSVYTYEDSRLVREDRVSKDFERESYTLFDYNEDNKIIREVTRSMDKKLISEKKYKYYTPTRKKSAIYSTTNGKESYIYYRYGFMEGRKLYEEEAWYSNRKEDHKYLIHLKRITFNLDGLPGRIEFFEKDPDQPDRKNKKLLKWYEDIKYDDNGRVQYVIRVNQENYARNYIKYVYDRLFRLSEIRVYSGYIQFNNAEMNFVNKFQLVKKVSLKYKLDKNLRFKEKNIIKYVNSEDIEIIIYDYPATKKIISNVQQNIPDNNNKNTGTTDKPTNKTDKTDKTDNKTDKIDKTDKTDKTDKPDESLRKNNTDKTPPVDNSSGTNSWAIQLKKKFTAQPLLNSEGNLILPLEGKQLSSINTQGKQNWNISVDGDIILAPIEHDKMIYFGTSSGTIYCVEMKSGKSLWNKPGFGTFLPKSKIIIANNSLIFARNNNTITSISIKDKNHLWEYKSSNNILFTPVADKYNVYLCTQFDLLAIDILKGTDKWKDAYEREISTYPIIVENTVITFTQAGIKAIELKNGLIQGNTPKWHIKEHIVLSPGYYREGFLYASTDEGFLIKVAVDKGNIVWSEEINLAQVYITGNKKYLYVTFSGDEFYIIDYNTGKTINRYEGVQNDHISTPILQNENNTENIIYYGTQYGNIYKDTLK